MPDGAIGDTPVMALHSHGDAVVRPAINLAAYVESLEDAGNVDCFVPGFVHREFGADLHPDRFPEVQLGVF